MVVVVVVVNKEALKNKVLYKQNVWTCRGEENCLSLNYLCIDISGFLRQFFGGARDMRKAYKDMKDANTIGADKYFHARGNHDATQRGKYGKMVDKILMQ